MKMIAPFHRRSRFGRVLSNSATLAVSMILCCPAIAQTGSDANQRTTAKEAEKAAKKACSAGDYQKGVDLLAGLYVDSSDPTHVYNQGRCYEQNNRFDEAIARFREYERAAPNLTAFERQAVDGHIAECEAELARRSPRIVAPAPPPVPAATVIAEPTAPVPMAPEAQQPAASPTPGRGLRIGGIATAVAGVVLIGVGVAFNIAANDADTQVSGGAVDKVSTRDHYETLGWVGYGSGAAALATGTVLYVLGWQSGRAAGPRVSLLPALGPGQASLALGGAF